MLISLLLINALLLGAVAFFLWRNFQLLEQQHRGLEPMLALTPPEPAQVQELLGRPKNRLITIEIMNPVQLAAQHNAFAGLLGNLAPGLLRKEVYRQAAGILSGELEKWQVMAEVKVHEPA